MPQTEIKAKQTSELQQLEAALRKQYPHIVPDSLREASRRVGAFQHKRTVVIRCTGDNCANTRRVATSDLHQVNKCPVCTHLERIRRRREIRRSRKR